MRVLACHVLHRKKQTTDYTQNVQVRVGSVQRLFMKQLNCKNEPDNYDSYTKNSVRNKEQLKRQLF